MELDTPPSQPLRSRLCPPTEPKLARKHKPSFTSSGCSGSLGSCSANSSAGSNDELSSPLPASIDDETERMVSTPPKSLKFSPPNSTPKTATNSANGSGSVGRMSDVSDIGNLIGDGSFSDADDSNGWMQKIDVTGFRQLTVPVNGNLVNEADNISVTKSELSHVPGARSIFANTNLHLLTPLQTQLDCGLTNIPTTILPAYGQLAYPSPCPSTISMEYSNQSLSSPPSKRNRPDSTTQHAPLPMHRQHQQPQQTQLPDSTTMLHSDISPVLGATTIIGAGGVDEKQFPKPTYSYSCLIALALKNSKSGRLTVSEIYNFMCENFPYFRSAPAGWKNSVRHNLSLNKCFEKIEIDSSAGQGRKACLWTLNPNRIHKMEQEILKWRDKDPAGVKESLANPQELEMIESGRKGMPGEFRTIGNNQFFLNRLPDLVQQTHQAFLLHQRFPNTTLPPIHSLPVSTALNSSHPDFRQSSLLPRFSQSMPADYGLYSSQAYVGNNIPQTFPWFQQQQPLLQQQYPPPSYQSLLAATPTKSTQRTIESNNHTGTSPMSNGKFGLQSPSQQSKLPGSPSYAHTPPYSPNGHSPQVKSGDWGPRSPFLNRFSASTGNTTLTTPTNFKFDSSQPSSVPQVKAEFSPFKYTSSTAIGNHSNQLFPTSTLNANFLSSNNNSSYDSAVNASNGLNGSSLLQSVLTQQSPCKPFGLISTSMPMSLSTLQSL